MAKGKPNNQRYRYPLPIRPIESLPTLILSNPVSWAYWIYKYYKSTNELASKIKIYFEGNDIPHITTSDPSDMLYLWDNGFFGTGQMSRSEPTWKNRTETRLNGKENSTLALEKVTERRRNQRQQFKKQRLEVERMLLKLRREGGSLEDERMLLEKERETLRAFRENLDVNNKSDDEDGNSLDNFRQEDLDIINEEGDVLNLESLELMPVEAAFLTFALPVLDISSTELFNKLHLTSMNRDLVLKFIIQYVGYHHYRSHGWCPRSGIKFGCDYLLYKRGPPFQHAEFCIMVLDCKTSNDYTWYSTIARVAGGAKKTLILCYVDRLISIDETIRLWEQGKYTEVFSQHKISEIIYKRWVPGKNRD